jgi:hypothetical protein
MKRRSAFLFAKTILVKSVIRIQIPRKLTKNARKEKKFEISCFEELRFISGGLEDSPSYFISEKSVLRIRIRIRIRIFGASWIRIRIY